MSGPGDEFILPDVGEGLDQAEIVEWLVAEGDQVARDQPLVEILTDKSQTQLPAPKAGVIRRLAFAEGDMAAVGQVLVEYEASDSSPPAAPAASESTSPAPNVAATISLAQPTRAPGARPKASPAVRRRALEAGIDLANVTGTGPGGRITSDDLSTTRSAVPDALSDQHRQTGSPGRVQLGQLPPGRHPLRGIRRVTAEAMEASWQIPHIHGADEIDATQMMRGRKKIKELQPERAANLTPLAFFVMAVASALRRYPLTNASIVVGQQGQPGHIDVHDQVNIGIAVATEAGLLVPVIRAADQRSLFSIADEIARLSSAARDRSITADELRAGTCTVTNYGSLGGRYATPIIRSPEAVIVGFGSIRPRPIVIDGVVAARTTLPIAVGADHRLVDGDLMTAFQEHIIELLSNPVALLAESDS